MHHGVFCSLTVTEWTTIPTVLQVDFFCHGILSESVLAVPGIVLEMHAVDGNMSRQASHGEHPCGPVTHVTTTAAAAAAAHRSVFAGGPPGSVDDRRMPVDATASIKYLGVAAPLDAVYGHAAGCLGTPVTTFLSRLL